MWQCLIHHVRVWVGKRATVTSPKPRTRAATEHTSGVERLMRICWGRGSKVEPSACVSRAVKVIDLLLCSVGLLLVIFADSKSALERLSEIIRDPGVFVVHPGLPVWGVLGVSII